MLCLNHKAITMKCRIENFMSDMTFPDAVNLYIKTPGLIGMNILNINDLSKKRVEGEKSLRITLIILEN